MELLNVLPVCKGSDFFRFPVQPRVWVTESALGCLTNVVVGCLLGYWASIILMCVVQAVVFFMKLMEFSSFSSSQFWCFKMYVLGYQQLKNEPHFGRLSNSLLCPLNWVALHLNGCLSLAVLFQLCYIQSLWNFLSLWSPCSLDC